MDRSSNLLLAAGGLLIAGIFAYAVAAPRPEASLATPAAPTTDGYGNLKLGARLEEIAARINLSDFSAYPVENCLDDLPLKGCQLFGGDGSGSVIREGIRYGMDLSLNKLDHLTDIDLVYRREGGIGKEECLSLLDRSIDWLATDYGTLYARIGEKEPGWTISGRSTAKGIRYTVNQSTEGSVISTLLRTAEAAPTEAVLRKPIVNWDDKRYASIFGSFMVINRTPHCDISIGVSEPMSVLRRE